MASSDFYLYLFIGILGVAYPVLLQVIARLDDKYSSIHVLEVFTAERGLKYFQGSLLISFVSIVIWSIVYYVYYLDLTPQCVWIYHLIKILLSFMVAILAGVFLHLVNKVITYYTPAKLYEQLSARHNKVSEGSTWLHKWNKIKQPSSLDYFKAITDILIISIRNNDSNLVYTVSQFFTDQFLRFRHDHMENDSSDPLDYPDEYYFMVRRTVEEIAKNKNPKFSGVGIAGNSAGSIWFLGDFDKIEISQNVLSHIWNNLKIMMNYRRSDLIMLHWETAYKYTELYLNEINIYTSDPEKKKWLEEHKRKRNEFLTMHYALGGLLLKERMYVTIREIFEHTNSNFGDNPLLTKNIYEIYDFYMIISDPFYSNKLKIYFSYPFQFEGGWNKNEEVIEWTGSYMALLFLRTYTCTHYTMGKVKWPFFIDTPKNSIDTKRWIEYMPKFITKIEDHLRNRELMKMLDLDHITLEWCEENNMIHPIEFLKNQKTEIPRKLNYKRKTDELDQNKVEKFLKSTKEKLVENISLHSIFYNENMKSAQSDIEYFCGYRKDENKEYYSQHANMTIEGYDTTPVEICVSELHRKIYSSFRRRSSIKYTLHKSDMISGIDQMALDSTYRIILFDRENEESSNRPFPSELYKDHHCGVPIHRISLPYPLQPSLFILKENDLPVFSFWNVDEEVIRKYEMTPLIGEHSIYASILDLNVVDRSLLEELAKGKDLNPYRMKVLISIYYPVKIIWAKNVSLIQLIPSDGGPKLTPLDEIQPWTEEE